MRNVINPHIHYANDGRGLRDVFVNGNKITNVVHADEKKGIVEFAPRPLRPNRIGGVYTRKLRGIVTVSPIPGGGYDGHS